MALHRSDTNVPVTVESSPECIGSGATLMQVDGVWTIFFDGHNYMSLLDATSREDALIQIAEMRLLKIGSSVSPEGKR